jgi:carboxyl-terminal processing protease
MPLRNLNVLLVSALVCVACYYKARYSRYAAVIADAMGGIEQGYFQDIDRRELFEGAMEGMVSRLDRDSSYLDTQALEELQENVLDQQFSGVGIEVVLDQQTGRLTVVSPQFGSPADKAGMRSGDVILAIDGQSTEGFTLQDAVHLMRGQRGTRVDLSVLHLGESVPEPISITRDVINVSSVIGDMRGPDGQWQFYLEEHPNIGYVRITTFGEKTLGELTEALRFKDHPVQGLIVDVRGNAGGLLTTAVAVCDLFIDSGEIVSTRDKHGNVEKLFRATSKSTICRLPMAVLVDRYSASASEIFAGAMQDHGRAVIIGERTWGKGTVQEIMFFEGRRSAIKLTTSTYWRPSHKNIHRSPNAVEEDEWGILPDNGFKIALTDDQYVKLLEARRQRHLVRAKKLANGIPSVQNGDNAHAESPIEQQDPQLLKAIENLQRHG